MRYATILLPGLLLLASQATAQETTFHVRIENVSQAGTLMPSDGSDLAVPLSPGVWVVHTSDDPLFTANTPDRGEGLEGIAEDGDPGTLAPNLSGDASVEASGVFNTPDGSAGPGPLMPGHAYSFSIKAEPGDVLSFATMFVQSNDLFYAPDGGGIALFDGAGTPLDQDVTDQVLLWDAGTEVNQEPGLGANQAPRQAAPDTGPDENGNVVLIADGATGPGGFTYPNVAEVIRVTINVGGADPDTAPKAFVDRFSEDAGMLFVRDESNGLPEANMPIDFDQGEPFLTQGLGPAGERVQYYNFDVQPTDPAPLYMLFREGEDSPVEGQHNIINVIPGDEGYNDFWHIHRVTVPADYVANSITSAAALMQAGYPMEATETIVNCPVVPEGSTASLRMSASNPAGLIQGWYRDQVVHYFLFVEASLTRTPSGKVPVSPIFVAFNVNPDQPGGGPASGFMSEEGSAQTHNVVATLPADENYSPLWSVNVYDNADFASVSNLATAQSANILGSGVALVNCPIVSLDTDTATEPGAVEQPERFVLHANYPNPFNPETIIRYDLNQPGHVQLRIFDTLGREVATLVDATRSPGTFEARWDGRDVTGRRLSSGVYFYRLILDQQAGQTRVMTLLK